MKKTVQVIMLPRKTDEPETGSLVKLRDKLYLFEQDINFRSTLPQHLYFTSNEEIKKGDWYFNNYSIVQATERGAYGIFNKVIATTDKSLNLPLITKSFIDYFIKNNGPYLNAEPIQILIEEGIITYWDEILQSKKQTLEEYAKVIASRYDFESTKYWIAYDACIAGANWQSKQTI